VKTGTDLWKMCVF